MVSGTIEATGSMLQQYHVPPSAFLQYVQDSTAQLQEKVQQVELTPETVKKLREGVSDSVVEKQEGKDVWLLWLGALLGAVFAKFLDALLSAGNATIVRIPTEPDW